MRVPRLGCSAWRRSRWAGPFNAVGSWRGREGAGGFFGSVIAVDLAVVTSGKCNVKTAPTHQKLTMPPRVAAPPSPQTLQHEGKG